MSGPLTQLVVLIVMTHGFRILSQAAGPRRGGLLLGLPSTTALVLCWYGHERGLPEALGTAEASLLGLVAAVTLPLAYARAAGSGWGLPSAPVAAVLGYLSAAALLNQFTGFGPGTSATAAALGVAAAVCVATRMKRGPDEKGGLIDPAGDGSAMPGRSRWGVLALRTVVPVISVLLVNVIRAIAGPERAGLFLTFPGMSLAVLVTTHMESGPKSACRLARALPAGNLGMVAFLTVFRYGCPRFGLAAGAALGFLTALMTLLALDGFVRDASVSRAVRAYHRATVPPLVFNELRRAAARLTRADAPDVWRRPRLFRAPRPNRRTRFSPFVEALVG